MESVYPLKVLVMTAQLLSTYDMAEPQRGNEQLIIQGISIDNQKFRPSDWVERISASMAIFGRDKKLRYTNFVQPCTLDGLRCLIVAKDLSRKNPEAYDFIIGFAQANNLRISEDRRESSQPVGEERRQKQWDYPFRKSPSSDAK
jgi:hypothetical protein